MNTQKTSRQTSVVLIYVCCVDYGIYAEVFYTLPSSESVLGRAKGKTLWLWDNGFIKVWPDFKVWKTLTRWSYRFKIVI